VGTGAAPKRGPRPLDFYGPKDDGTYIAQFKTAEGDVRRSRSRGPRRS
jgi:hypothetical protein